MKPELFTIGGFTISTFGPMLVAAFFAAYLQLRSGLEKTGAGTEEDAASMVLTAGLLGIVGSKAYYAILHGDWHLLFDRAGLVWYGGFFLGAAGIVWTVRRRGMPFWSTLDALTVALALGYAVGRIGCLLVGDDYGVPTDLPWGVELPEGAPPSTAANLRSFGVDVPASVPGSTVLAVHPTPLYESLAALGIWGMARRFWSRSVKPGTTAGLVLLGLAIERFLVEILRAKDDRFLGVFTVAQALSLLLAGVAVVVWVRRRKSEEA